MLEVTDTISIDENELEEHFIRASGAGGQKVNRIATAVQLRFDVKNSPSLPDEVKERLALYAGSRLTGDGILIIQSQEHRTQDKNRTEARKKLVELICLAAVKPKVRKKTKLSKKKKAKRIQNKRLRGEKKQMRKKPDW